MRTEKKYENFIISWKTPIIFIFFLFHHTVNVMTAQRLKKNIKTTVNVGYVMLILQPNQLVERRTLPSEDNLVIETGFFFCLEILLIFDIS